MSFKKRLATIQKAKKSVLCVGLDPDPDRLPPGLLPDAPLPERILAFNKGIIRTTAPFASAFKTNLAFYEALGPAGWEVLQQTIELFPTDVLSIADGKRADIGNSSKFYAQSTYETYGFDSCTVAPYMGTDSMSPFLSYPDKLAFILARTSNPGARDLQEQWVGEQRLYELLTKQIAALPHPQRFCTGLVVGATSPDALAHIRGIVPGMPFLIPGVGAQGGDPASVMQAAYDEPGSVLINSSRGIIYASSGENFAEAAGHAAKELQTTLYESI